MPKANQKRGRRMKRKHDELADEGGEHDFQNADFPQEEHDRKRRRSFDDGPSAYDAQQHDFLPLHHDEPHGERSYSGAAGEPAFFGMLDEQEQEYFKRADELFELNDFESPEAKKKLVAEVHAEAAGKQLKIAQSQSCSRLLERLIQLSTAAQLKGLFRAFSGNFLALMSHRFASHCCESLFSHAAPFVAAEVLGKAEEEETNDNGDEVFVTLENLFLHTLAELEGNLPFMLTDRYASHALRALLRVLSGEPVSKEIDKQAARKTKTLDVTASTEEERKSPTLPVPESFSPALEKLIAGTVAGFDTAKLRALAAHPIASPTLQALLRLEMAHYGRARAKDASSVMHILLPDEPFTAECESAAFLSGLAYDPVGAHLVEAVLRYAPAKLFKKLYSTLFKERLASYARNEVATYIDCRILERLGHDDLQEAHGVLAPLIPTLTARRWTSLTRTLIARCVARGIDTKTIADQLQAAFDNDGAFDVAQVLFPSPPPKDDTVPPGQQVETDKPASEAAVKVHFNLLAQAMLSVPGPLSALILDALISCSSEFLLRAAHDPVASRTLQAALTAPTATIIQRRKLIGHLYGHIGAMAADRAASHVVDCIWTGTHGLAFIRERIAEELAENEATLRESPCGRGVWKNWKMDIYKRRRGEWVRYSKQQASNDGFQSFEEMDEPPAKIIVQRTTRAQSNGAAGVSGGGQTKTPLQLARERHMRLKLEKAERAARTEKGEKTDSARDGPVIETVETNGKEKKERKGKKEKGEKKERKEKKEKRKKEKAIAAAEIEA